MNELEQAKQARAMYNAGQITREEAKQMIAPYAARFNAASKCIAKKYGMRPKRFSLAAFLR